MRLEPREWLAGECHSLTVYLVHQTPRWHGTGTGTQKEALALGSLCSRVLGTFICLRGIKTASSWWLTLRVVFPFFPCFCRAPPRAAGIRIPKLRVGESLHSEHRRYYMPFPESPNKLFKLFLGCVCCVYMHSCPHTWMEYVWQPGEDAERLSILSEVTEQNLFLIQVL